MFARSGRSRFRRSILGDSEIRIAEWLDRESALGNQAVQGQTFAKLHGQEVDAVRLENLLLFSQQAAFSCLATAPLWDEWLFRESDRFARL